MLPDYCIENMTVDELKKYAFNQNKIEERYRELVYAKNEVVDALQRLCNTQGWAHDMLLQLNVCRDNHAAFENELLEKYEEYRPEIGCASTLQGRG